MQRIYVLLLLLTLALVPSVEVYAQNATPVSDTGDTTTEKLENARQLIKIRRDDIKNALQEARQDFMEQVAQEREKMREKIKSDREEFVAKLASIRDQQKKVIVERIDTKILALNTRHTDKLAGALDKLQTILDKISSNGAELKSNGTDTSDLDSAVTSAQNAINSAKSAVSTQSSNSYTIQITDETKLGQAVSPVVRKFRQDIQATHQLVVEARKAVQKAGVELAKLKGDSSSATNSAAVH